MSHRPLSLSEFFHEYRQRGQPLVLATIVHTVGSTYRKAGAQMLLAPDGAAAGLLSGGCLESDLMERALAVLDHGRALVVEYDTRNSDDLLWGIGLGCEGAIRILLVRLDSGNDYQPFAHDEQCRDAGFSSRMALVSASTNPAYPLGTAYRPGADRSAPATVLDALAQAGTTDTATVETDGATFLIIPIEPPTRLLLLGAGPDALPLVEIAGLMGWQVTVLDHRPAYAAAERFPRARQVLLRPAQDLPELLAHAHYDAAVVMSHHLPSDQTYLTALADSSIGYIGLLGPAPRRARLLHDIGPKSTQLGHRLHGPAGLDIGARTPEAIALAIVAEIQTVAAGRPGGHFRAN